LGIGDWGLGPIPNPQSPIPKIIIKQIKYSLTKYTAIITNYNIKQHAFIIIEE